MQGIILIQGLRKYNKYNFAVYFIYRIDPFSCRLILPGQVCDPAEILTPDERRILNEKITRVSVSKK